MGYTARLTLRVGRGTLYCRILLPPDLDMCQIVHSGRLLALLQCPTFDQGANLDPCCNGSSLGYYCRASSHLPYISTLRYSLDECADPPIEAQTLVTIFQCRPTHAFWARFAPDNPLPPSKYHCGVEDANFFYGTVIPNIGTDILMLALPIPYIWHLQLQRSQKLALGGTFLVGIL